MRMAGFLPMLVLLVSACSSEVSFRVERYSHDSGPAREEYERLHPEASPAELRARLELAKQYSDDFRQYAIWLQSYTETVVLANASGAEFDAQAKTTEQYGTAKNAVDDAFSAFDGVLTSALASASKGTPVERRLQERLLTLFLNAVDQLRAHDFVLNKAEVDEFVKGIAEFLKDPSYLAKIDQIATIAAKLVPAGSAKNAIQAGIANKQPDKPYAERLLRHLQGLLAVSEARARVELTLDGWIKRSYTTEQDLSDRYYDFIAEHPENWQLISNRAFAAGDGDAQYVLVLDKLDGQWKKVAVDPTKVIQARLRILRKIANTLVAGAGMAMTAFGVPIPPGLLSPNSPEGTDSMDYSILTAEAQALGDENDARAKHLRWIIDKFSDSKKRLSDAKDQSATAKELLAEIKSAIDAIQPPK